MGVGTGWFNYATGIYWAEETAMELQSTTSCESTISKLKNRNRTLTGRHAFGSIDLHSFCPNLKLLLMRRVLVGYDTANCFWIVQNR